MRLIQGDYFIKRDFAFYDSCVLAVLGPTIFNIYEVLRRFVWRSETTGPTKVRTLLKQGKLVARVRQRTIGEYLGLTRETINRSFRLMRDLGWVSKVEEGKSSGDASTFQLGEVILDSSGCKHEAFFADAWMQMLWESMVKGAKACFRGTEGFTEDLGLEEDEPEPDEGGDALGRKCVRNLHPDRRTEMVRDFLFQRGVAVGEEPPCDPDDTGVCGPRHRGMTLTAQPPHPPVMPASHNRIENYTPSECSDLSREEGNCEARGPLAPLALAASPDPHDPHAPDPHDPHAPTTVVEDSAADVGASKESSDNPSDHVVVPFPQATQDFVTRLRKANQAEARSSGEQRMREKRTKEEKAKNLLGGDGKLSRKVMAGLETLWLKGFSKTFPGLKTMPWGPPEKHMIEKLVLGPNGKHGYGEEVVGLSLKYVLLEWVGIKNRFLKGNGLAPSISFLYHHHGTLCIEAQRWIELLKRMQEYEAWNQQHPGTPAPSALTMGYAQASDELDALRGLAKRAAP
jgi:hypothetical protein